MYNKKIHVIVTERKLLNLFFMFLKNWIKQLGPCNINRSIESTNDIIKDIDNNFLNSNNEFLQVDFNGTDVHFKTYNK